MRDSDAMRKMCERKKRKANEAEKESKDELKESKQDKCELKESKQDKWNYDWIAGTEGWGADRSPPRATSSGNETDVNHGHHDHCANTTTTTIQTTTTTTTTSASQILTGSAMALPKVRSPPGVLHAAEPRLAKGSL